MPQTIRIRRSTTAAAVPSSLLTGEIAINEADGIIYYRNASGVVTEYRSRIADGDKGDIATTGNGATWTIDPSAVTYDKCAPYTVTTFASQTLSTLLGQLVLCAGGTATTITVPTNATTAIAVGRRIDFVQTGAGQVTFAGAVGVTLQGTPGLKLRAQFSACSLIKTATDTWVLIGDLTA
jgi:hypothetical protein